MKLAFALVFAAPLFAQTCTYVVSPASFSISAATYPGKITVTQAPGSACGNYSATTQANWIHIPDGSGGAPGTSVTFTADANLSASPRAGTIIIALQNVTVTQAGATCNFGITPTTQSFPVGGGPGVANITAGCSWQATTNVPSWITFNGLTTGISNATVSYTVAPNTCVDARNGTI